MYSGKEILDLSVSIVRNVKQDRWLFTGERHRRTCSQMGHWREGGLKM
jgi:hypothetical protein